MSSNTDHYPRLKTSTAVAYGAPGVMLAALSFTFYIYFPKFFVDHLGFDLTVLGVIVLASRMWDAITDPAIGALSDRTRTKWGRRRPWMVGAAIPLGVSFYLLAAPPLQLGLSSTTVLTVLAFVFFLAWTMVTVPYESLGPEISFDYDERNRLFGIRESGVLLGTVTAAALPALLVPGALGMSGYGALGIIFGVLLFGGIWWCVIGVRERDLTEIKRPHGSPWQNLRHALSNRPFMTLLAAYSIWSLGAALSATIFLFFFEHVLQSTAGPFVLVVYLVTGIVFMPFWVYASRRFEKRPAWIAAVTVSAVSISGLALLGPGDVVVASVMLALAGTGLGGAIAIPPSMQADVIDYDELKSGERREGQYIGLWALAKKLGMATSAGLALPALDWSGYLGGQIVQPEDTVTALKWLFVGGPVICNALAVSIALTYTIDRREHQAMRAEIDATTDMQSST